MSSLSFARLALKLLVTAIAVHLLLCQAANAQKVNTGTWNPAPAPKPKPKPAPPPVRRTHQAPRPAPPRAEPRPLLSIQYRILKVNSDGSEVEVSPLTVFSPGDRLRFAFQSNQQSFLHIVRQNSPESSAEIFFPDSRINNGYNLMVREREFTVPARCGPGVAPSACSYPVDSSRRQEIFTFIISREPTLDLYGRQAEVGGEITSQVLNQLVNGSGQRIALPRRGDTTFSLRFSNLNARNDELIAVRYVLNKRAPSR